MERTPSVTVPMNIPEEETPTSENLHLLHGCCDSEHSRCDIKHFENDLMKQNQQFTSDCLPNIPSDVNDDVSFTQSVNGSISESTNPLTGNTNTQSNMYCHETAAVFVGQILDKALDSIFRKKDSTQYAQEECKKSETHKCLSNAERIKTCLKSPDDFQLCSALDIVNTEVDGLVSSSFKSPSQDKYCHLVPGQLQSNDLERNFSKMGSVKETDFISFEKSNISISNLSNNSNELMVFCVNSTSEKCERKSKLDFSMLRDILSGGDYLSSYPHSKTAFKNILNVENKETTIFLPKYDEQAASALQIQKKIAANNTFFQTLKEDVKNTFLGQSNKALSTEITSGNVANELCNFDPGTASCKVNKITAHLEFADSSKKHLLIGIHDSSFLNSVTNDLDNIIQCKASCVINKIKTNKSTSALNSIPANSQMNHSDLISAFVSGSSRTVSLLGDQLDTLQCNFTQSDQTVPCVFKNGVMQNVFETSGDVSVKTVTQRTSAERDLILPFSTFKSSELNETRTSDNITSLCSDYSTNDCDEIISLDLLQMFVVKHTKTVTEQNIEFCNSNNLDLPSKLQINKSNNKAKHQGIGNSTIVSSSEIRTSNPVPKASGPILKSSSVSGQSNTGVHSNEEAHKPRDFDCNDLFEISNSSWSDIDQIKERVDVAEKTLDKIVEERVLINLPLLNEGGDYNFVTDSYDSDIDELDRVIDDSIKKYENFTVDVSVSVTPSTAEKSCQTEMIDIQNLARCKRCLEFVDEPTEPIKKKKLNSNEDFNFKLPTTSDCHINLNDSPAHSTVYNNIINDKIILPSSSERVQPGRFSSPVNIQDLFTSTSSNKFSNFDSPRTDDEVHELDGEGSLFDAEDNGEHDRMDWSNESSYDSEQEVPVSPQADEDMDDADDEATDTSSETEYFEALEDLRNARKL